MLKEFKDFIARGNVIELAVAVIIGAAFGPIVNSAVSDIIMPPIGMMLGNVDFKDLFISLNRTAYPSLAAAREAGAPVIAYGNFLNTVINFILISFAIFLLVKQVNRFKTPAPVAAPTTRECPQCLMAIPISAKRCGHCTSQL